MTDTMESTEQELDPTESVLKVLHNILINNDQDRWITQDNAQAWMNDIRKALEYHQRVVGDKGYVLRGEQVTVLQQVLTAAAGLHTEEVHGDGTGARNTGNLRVTQHNLQTAKHQDEVTWLLTARVAMAEVAVVESDDQRLRRQLVHLAGTVIGWIHDIDQRG